MAIDKLEYAITFIDVTPESLEHGDIDEAGFIDESIIFDDFEELLGHVTREGYLYWSESSSTPSYGAWASTQMVTEDYASGRQREESIHPKNVRAHRYLIKAMAIANKAFNQ